MRKYCCCVGFLFGVQRVSRERSRGKKSSSSFMFCQQYSSLSALIMPTNSLRSMNARHRDATCVVFKHLFIGVSLCIKCGTCAPCFCLFSSWRVWFRNKENFHDFGAIKSTFPIQQSLTFDRDFKALRMGVKTQIKWDECVCSNVLNVYCAAYNFFMFRVIDERPS